MDIDVALERYENAEKAIQENKEIKEQTAKAVLDHLMDGIVPYYGGSFDWESDYKEPHQALVCSSHFDLYLLVLHCEQVAEHHGYTQRVTIEGVTGEDGTECVRITTEAPHGNGPSDFTSVDVPKEYLRMTPEEFHEMIEKAIAEGRAEQAEERRIREEEIRRRMEAYEARKRDSEKEG